MGCLCCLDTKPGWEDMATKVNPEETTLPRRALKAQAETPSYDKKLHPEMLLAVRAAMLMPGDQPRSTKLT